MPSSGWVPDDSGRINSKRLRIFVVEDHSGIRGLFSRFLPTLGHWVESADSIDMALERLQQDGFDVLLTDLWLPDANGRCLLLELCFHDKLPPYVVSTSASPRSDMAQLSRTAGCFAHLEQPFRLSEIEQALEAICGALDAATSATESLTEPAAPRILLDPELYEESVRLRTEAHLLRASVAQNILLCAKAVEEAQAVYALSQARHHPSTMVWIGRKATK